MKAPGTMGRREARLARYAREAEARALAEPPRKTLLGAWLDLLRKWWKGER